MKYRVYDVLNRKFVPNLIDQSGRVIGDSEYAVQYFTGFADKNEVEIYTNDLVEIEVSDKGQVKIYKYITTRHDSGMFLFESTEGTKLVEYVKHQGYKARIVGNADVKLTNKEKTILADNAEGLEE